MTPLQGDAARGGGPTKEQLQELVGKAVTDEKFREKLFMNPRETANEMGFEFSDRQVQVFDEMKPELMKQLGRGTAPHALPLVLIPIADVAIVAAFA